MRAAQSPGKDDPPLARKFQTREITQNELQFNSQTSLHGILSKTLD